MSVALRSKHHAARWAAAIGVLACCVVWTAHADNAPPLVLEATIALPHTAGRIDHLAIDVQRRHLFVAELGNNTVDVVDLAQRRVVHRLAGLKEPQGVLYVPSADRLAVASAGDGTLRLFNADSFAPQAVIDLQDDADNVRLAPDGRDVLVGYGNGGIADIDPGSGAVRQKVTLGAHPEGFQVTPHGLAYVNLPDARRIDVADLAAGKVVAAWRYPDLSGNFPMALGESNVVTVVFRGPALFVRIDRATGHEISRNDTCGDADDVFFDARRQRYYVSCGAGAIDSFEVAGGHVTARAPVATSAGARTSLFVPEADRLFVAVRAGLLGADAAIRIMRPLP